MVVNAASASLVPASLLVTPSVAEIVVVLVDTLDVSVPVAVTKMKSIK